MRRTVEEMIACGESQNTVARSLCIDDDTLRKHFPDEIANGWSNRRREIVELLFANARKGNISAQKRLEEMTRLAAADPGFDAALQPEPKPEPVGKKVAAEIAAKTAGAGTEWGDDLDPNNMN